MLIDTSAKNEVELALKEMEEEDPGSIYEECLPPTQECDCPSCEEHERYMAKNGEALYEFFENVKIKTLCAICRAELNGELLENPVYKFGELDYTELAHKECGENNPCFN